MKNRLFAFVNLIGIWLSSSTYADVPEQNLDVSGVTAVSITGDASSIHFTTLASTAYRASIVSRRSGWFSFFSECRNGGELRVDNGTLYIDVAPSSWMDSSECTVEINANLPSGNSISINQSALLAKLDGDFSSITIASKAGDLSFEGHASNVSVKGEAIKARLVFDRVDRDENIDFDARALDVYLVIGHGAPISYTVAAIASFIDSSLANIPDSKPSINIKGSYVRATIR
ncbi:hypothetical protein CYK37_11865 [Mesorhizobium loti]|nr:hypothetical protein [Mesorhizobium loti]PLP59168.1 hypothetical protein CYK37_11865 [Mesorhizobium loti]